MARTESWSATGRHLHRYSVRFKGGMPVEMVLAESVQDLEAENARLREEKTHLRDLLRSAQNLFRPERDEWGGDPEHVARIKKDIEDVLRRG